MSDDARVTKADVQLEAIARLNTALDTSDIDYWLFGGWAVDFWVGSITREHDDIDVVAFRVDYDAIRAELLEAGWEHTPTPNDVVGTRYAWRGVEVEFTFVIDKDGSVVIPLPDGPIVWSDRPLGNGRRELRGVASRVIPLELLVAGKQAPRPGAAESAKDRSDLEALLQLK